MTHSRIFGYPDEWRDFEQRNRAFFHRFSNLQDALDAAFVGDANVSTAADKAIFFVGRQCIEDFMELLCLAANGYGFGALKLLRGLYERAVTTSYLSSHPEEAENFFNFRFVSRNKTLRSYVAARPQDQGLIDKASEAQEKYDQVKDRFEVNDCKTCGTKRTNQTWSKNDFVSMAKKTDLGILLPQAYYEPLNHQHSTAESLTMRLETSISGQIGFNPKSQRSEADRALQIAHGVMVELLKIEARHFKMQDLAAKAEICAEEHVEAWANRETAIDHTST